jgi:hypothetical protein
MKILFILFALFFFSCSDFQYITVNFQYVITGNSSNISVKYLRNDKVDHGSSEGSTWETAVINTLPWNYSFSVKIKDECCQNGILEATNNQLGTSIVIQVYCNGQLYSEKNILGESSDIAQFLFCD